MARGTTLTQLLTMLRAEVGHSTNVAAGIDNTPALMQKLQRTQTMLYDDYDWPFLRETWQVPLTAGTRYYNLPHKTDGSIATSTGSVLNMERIERVAINYSGRPVPIDRGIDWEQYAQYNSDNNERASPARRWDIKSALASIEDFTPTQTPQLEQIEIWPIPTDNTQLLMFKGIRQLRPLVNPGDPCDIDDILIVLTAGHEILMRAKSADATEVKAAAAARLKQLKPQVKAGARTITMSGTDRSRSVYNKGRTIIRIGSQTN